jgi:hypothetical protein
MDWSTSGKIALMTDAQKGIYVSLLVKQWLDPSCSITTNKEILQKLLPGSRWKNIEHVIKNCFDIDEHDPAKARNSRLFVEHCIAINKSQKAKKSVMCREVKRKKHVDEDTTRIEQGFDKDLTRIGNKLRNNQEPNHLNPMSLESSNDERTMNERSSIQIQTHIQTEPIIKKKKIRPAFVKPTVEEIEAFCRQRNKGIKGQEFFDHYETRGWVVGKNQTPMKDWQAAVRTWEGNKNGLQASSSQRPAGRNFTKEREQEQRDKYERLRSRNNILPGNLHKDKSNGTGNSSMAKQIDSVPKVEVGQLGGICRTDEAGEHF